MEWMILPLRRYADFQGRSRRLEYWMFTLFILLTVFAASALLFALIGMSGNNLDTVGAFGGVLISVLLILYLAILIPSVAVQVRRFHDRDMSGWFVLLNFIPYVGGLIVFVFMLLPRTDGPNQYGPDPKDPDGIDGLDEVFG